LTRHLHDGVQDSLKRDSILKKPIPIGLPGGDRTPDPQLRRLLLYPTELRAEFMKKGP
jgi:hypothetical protein